MPFKTRPEANQAHNTREEMSRLYCNTNNVIEQLSSQDK
jgi:hypothetical protein